MDGKKLPWSLRILSFLEEAGQPYDDDCLAKKLGATRRQTINAVCNRLADRGKLVRQQALCPRCGRIKLHNFLPKWVDKLPPPPQEPQGKPRLRREPKLVEERKATLQKIEFIHQRALNELEVQAALHGINVPIALTNQIRFHKNELAKVRHELKELQ
jgi:hypothetical protein